MSSESPLKRQREVVEDEIQEIHETKRQKSYNDILSLLEEEEEEPTQDISSFMTTLQQEISCSSSDTSETQNSCPNPSEECPCASSDTRSSTSNNGEDDKEKVMRHLLEASDDELGLPNAENFRVDTNGEDLFNINNLDAYSFGDCLWEFEDEAANYYTMLQSELFM